MTERLKGFGYSPGVAVIAAFLVRAVVFYHMNEALQAGAVRELPHGAEMGNVAAAIAWGWGFSSPLRWSHTGATAWFTPAYPYLLAGIFRLFGVYSYASDLISHTLDIAFVSFTCWPICAIGTKVFGRATGVLSAWGWALLPASILTPIIWTWDTPLAALWMALLVAATLQLRGSDRIPAWAGYGAMWAAGAMINASLLSVLPFLSLWAIWPLRRQFVPAIRVAALSAAVFLAGLAPWMVRNYIAFHKFVPLRSNFGLELWLGNNPGVPDTWSPFLHPNDNAEEGAKYIRMTEIPYMEEKQHEAFLFIREHPSDALRFTFRRFEETWLGMSDAPADVWEHSTLSGKFSILENSFFSLLSLLGVLAAYRTQKERVTPLALILLVFPAVFYVTHSSERYRFPMDTVMVVLAAYAIVCSLSWIRERGSALATPTPGRPAMRTT